MSRERRIDVYRLLCRASNDEPLTEDECELRDSLTPEDREQAAEDNRAALRLYEQIATDGKLALMLLGQYGIDEHTTFDHAMQVMSPEDAADITALQQDIATNQHITNVLYGTEWSSRV